MRKLRHLSLRSAAATLTGKKREKTAIGQAKYQQAFDTEQQCKRKIEELQTELGVVTDKVLCGLLFSSYPPFFMQCALTYGFSFPAHAHIALIAN